MKTNKTVMIDGRRVGEGQPPYIIAEMSANHLGDFDRAIRIMEEAAKAGADALKLQTYTPDTITLDHDGPGFKLDGGLWDGRRLHELYQEAHMPWEWHEALFAKGRELGITVFSSPFDHTAVDLLQSLDAPAYKIASFEIVDIPLIQRCAATGKPMIISTGMATFDEIGEAIKTAQDAGCGMPIILHCVSGYPAPFADCNLQTIRHLADSFDVPIGLSDHTMGVAVPTAAISIGATVIEKHFTLARSDGGPDGAFSLEPDELKQLVDNARIAWESLGEATYKTADSEARYRELRRSLYAVEDISAGDALTHQNFRSIRPGYGIAPKHQNEVLQSTAKVDIKRGTPLSWDHLVKP